MAPCQAAEYGRDLPGYPARHLGSLGLLHESAVSATTSNSGSNPTGVHLPSEIPVERLRRFVFHLSLHKQEPVPRQNDFRNNVTAAKLNDMASSPMKFLARDSKLFC